MRKSRAEYYRKWREANREHCREWDRKYRALHRDKERQRSREWYAGHTETRKTQSRQWMEANPEKARAHQFVNYALKRGTLIRERCQVCSDNKTQAHHTNYALPLQVIWLCALCHKKAHIK